MRRWVSDGRDGHHGRVHPVLRHPSAAFKQFKIENFHDGFLNSRFSTMLEEASWDTSKENFQPLREGRTAECLAAAQPKATDRDAKRR